MADDKSAEQKRREKTTKGFEIVGQVVPGAPGSISQKPFKFTTEALRKVLKRFTTGGKQERK